MNGSNVTVMVIEEEGDPVTTTDLGGAGIPGKFESLFMIDAAVSAVTSMVT